MGSCAATNKQPRVSHRNKRQRRDSSLAYQPLLFLQCQNAHVCHAMGKVASSWRTK